MVHAWEVVKVVEVIVTSYSLRSGLPCVKMGLA